MSKNRKGRRKSKHRKQQQLKTNGFNLAADPPDCSDGFVDTVDQAATSPHETNSDASLPGKRNSGKRKEISLLKDEAGAPDASESAKKHKLSTQGTPPDTTKEVTDALGRFLCTFWFEYCTSGMYRSRADCNKISPSVGSIHVLDLMDGITDKTFVCAHWKAGVTSSLSPPTVTFSIVFWTMFFAINSGVQFSPYYSLITLFLFVVFGMQTEFRPKPRPQ